MALVQCIVGKKNGEVVKEAEAAQAVPTGRLLLSTRISANGSPQRRPGWTCSEPAVRNPVTGAFSSEGPDLLTRLLWAWVPYLVLCCLSGAETPKKRFETA